eukprot:184291_1
MRDIMIEGLNALNSKHKLPKKNKKKLIKLFPAQKQSKIKKRSHNKSSKHQSNRPRSNTKQYTIPVTVLLVDGYIRSQFINPYNVIYPSVLTKIFCEYLDHLWVCPNKYNHCMKRNGSFLIRPPLSTAGKNVDMIIGSSRGYSKGVFEFQLKCIKPAMDAIGIMTEIEECEIEQWIGATKGNTYYYMPGTRIGGGGIYTGMFTKNAPAEQYMNSEKQWRKNDMIKIRVDCDYLTCKFFKNDKKVGKTIHIEPNCTYHPVLATSKDGSEYELIID